MPNTTLYDARFIARKCNIQTRVVLLLARQGVIPSIKINRKTIRFFLPDVVDALRIRTSNNIIRD